MPAEAALAARSAPTPWRPATGRPVFVAEVSSNHAVDLARCRAFIAAAADAGCQAVKFQLFRLDGLFAPEILARSAEHRRRREWELPPGFVPELAAVARERGLGFGCTPFDLRGVDELAPHVDFLKVASYEILWRPLLERCGATGLPLVLSTGMATLGEVREAVTWAVAAGARDVTVLHCVSHYPCRPQSCNLAAIATLRHELAAAAAPARLRCGWSDHSVSPAVVLRAVHRWGAEMVELHLDLDGRGAEYATGHCWLPGALRSLVETAGDGAVADGDGRKQPAACEEQERLWRADPEDGLRPLRSIRAEFAP
ncbi:MAG: N-acetylneuraminate synthase family protein [Candidatus Krumholzibacteriia bacterium]